MSSNQGTVTPRSPGAYERRVSRRVRRTGVWKVPEDAVLTITMERASDHLKYPIYVGPELVLDLGWEALADLITEQLRHGLKEFAVTPDRES